jgi:N-methylhydantoinase B/oxoprolinase/acetone carboxylase alpha subunit
VRVEIRIDGDEIIVDFSGSSDQVATLLGDRHKFQPYGVFGGRPGILTQTILMRDGQETALASKQSLPLRRGDIISYRLSGRRRLR